jgi:hypothetical protein
LVGTTSVAQQALAASLAFILVSCSTTRHPVAGPASSQYLARYAIRFETQPDGTVAHTWVPIAELDLTQYQYPWGAPSIEGEIERTVMTDDDISRACNEVMERCLELCMARAMPDWASHIRARFPNTAAGRRQAKYVFCQEECAKERNACYAKLRRERQEAMEFSSADRAIDWIKRHKTELLVGSVVIIAAVAFIAVACGSRGCVILIPIVLVASSSAPAAPCQAEAVP